MEICSTVKAPGSMCNMRNDGLTMRDLQMVHAIGSTAIDSQSGVKYEIGEI